MDKIPKEVVYEIIKVIYENAGKFSRKGAGSIEGSEYDNSIKLFMSLINDKMGKDNIYSTLEEAVMKTTYLPYAVLIVHFCQKKGRGSFFNIYESIDIDKLQEKVSKRLKEHFVDKKRDIFKEIPEKDGGWILVLYQWGSNWDTFKGNNNKIVNKYVLSLIKGDAKKFITFLASQEGLTFSDAPVFNLKEISRIYSLSDLNKLAEKFKADPSLSSKEKGKIKIFLKTYHDYKNNN